MRLLETFQDFLFVHDPHDDAPDARSVIIPNRSELLLCTIARCRTVPTIDFSGKLQDTDLFYCVGTKAWERNSMRPTLQLASSSFLPPYSSPLPPASLLPHTQSSTRCPFFKNVFDDWDVSPCRNIRGTTSTL